MKSSLKKALYVLLAAAVIGGGVYFWKRHSAVPAAQRFQLQTIERGGLSQSVSANGTLNPVTLVSVGTQVSGTVRKLHVDFNAKVEKGQILAELDDSLLQAQVQQSAANARNAQASLDLARANEARMQSLYKQEYVSRQDLDSAVQARKSAEAQLALYQAQMQRDRANLNYSVIRSPVAGVVVDRSVDVGQTVAASFQTPTLFKIAQDLSKMQIDSAFAEADIGNIRVGQPVKFTVDAFPDRNFRGVVKQIRLNPTTTQNVVTYDVVVSVDNPEQILLPGMTAYVNIVVAKREDALLVPNAALRYHPSEALLQQGGGAGQTANVAAGGKNGNGSGMAPGKRKKRDLYSGTVYVLRGDKLQPVSVKLGITDNRNTEVVGGALKEGDQVVVGENQAGDQSSSGVRMRMF